MGEVRFKRVAVYGRVSDEEAASRDHGSLEQQEHMGRCMTENLSVTSGIPHKVTHLLIEEDAITGATLKRPKYQRLLTLVRNKSIDVIVSKELSRLNRKVSHFSELLDLCEKNNVRLVIKGLDVDPSTPHGKMMFHMMASLAEMERDMVSERVKSSIRSRRKNNQLDSGGLVIFGFDKHPTEKGHRVPNEKELKHVEFLMKYFLETASYKSTVEKAKSLGIKNKNGNNFGGQTIATLLTNPKYIGLLNDLENPGKMVPAKWGPVICEDLFNRVQVTARTISDKYRNKNVKSKKRINLLIGVLQYEDGSTFSPDSSFKKGTHYYWYRNRENKVWIKAEEIEKAVLNHIASYQSDKKILSAIAKERKGQIDKISMIDQQLRELDKTERKFEAQESEIWEIIRKEKGLSGFAKDRIAKLEAAKKKAQKAIESLKAERDELASKSFTATGLTFSLKALFRVFSLEWGVLIS